MYATLEANSQCNKKREEKKKGRLKNCGSTARQPVRQTDRQRESWVCERDERARFTFFFLLVVVVVVLLLYSSFVLLFLRRTFCADKTHILSLPVFFLSSRNWTQSMCNIWPDEQNGKDREKKEEGEEEKISILEKKTHT